jgi:hypothetical protein
MSKAAKVQNGNAFKSRSSAIADLLHRRPAREGLIFIAFCLCTVVMTWPWVLHLRDAVADRGDPYMIAWTLWWDYHQTFNDPLQLFNANIFYPYQYTLAFSENDYGIAILFFPLFAVGLRPLTVHSIATFLGFAFCGYGAFRLTRTLTGKNGPAWIAGLVFAFIPFRFHVLSHLHYLFAGWIPLMLESLVLFARRPDWKRASWMGTAFFMNGLSCISWFIMTIVPLALTVIFLVIVQKSLWRSRNFWIRGCAAIAIASVALFPFLWPYYKVSVVYGFRWPWWEFALNSPSLIHWFKAEPRNRVWQNFGSHIPGGHKLFPGILVPLLALASLILRRHVSPGWIARGFSLLLHAVIAVAAVAAVLAIGYGDRIYTFFGYRFVRLNDRSINHAIVIILIALVARVALAIPALLRRFKDKACPQIWMNNSEHTMEAIGVGLIWTVAGFLSSLGANFFFNRWLHDYLFLFQSIRLPSRAAMVCYLGLAVLAGIGASCVAARAQHLLPRRRVQSAVLVLVGLAILFELHAAPLRIENGEVNPSSVSLRLRQTQMSGGLVELPSGVDVSRHFYMLRAADHGKPLVNATSSFISPLTDQINNASEERIAPGFMDLLEKIPTSYLVVHNDRLPPAWQREYEMFLAHSLISGRLRFINRFDGHDDLYAVVRTEPNAISEAAAPFPLVEREWAELIDEDESNMFSPADRSQSLYRLYLAATGRLPRYQDFMRELKNIGRGVNMGSESEDYAFQTNLNHLADSWLAREPLVKSLNHLDETRFIDRLVANSGIALDRQERTVLISLLAGKSRTRAEVLLNIVANQQFIDKENARSLVLLHYFAYLHRNPGDLPDNDLSGFNYWIQDFAKEPDVARLSAAFQNSIEYRRNQVNR